MVVRQEAKSKRTFQRLLSTNFAHWGLTVQNLKKGWIKLISPDDFDFYRYEKAVIESAHQTSHDDKSSDEEVYSIILP